MAELDKLDFQGTVIRRDPDGYGVVEISGSVSKDPKFGIFTREVLQNPDVFNSCNVGSIVHGRARVVSGGGLRIVHIDPVK